MKIPGDDRLTNAEIVAFVDLAAAEIPGWKPSEHFDEHSLIEAYREAQTGEGELFRLLTASPLLALLVTSGAETVAAYERHHTFKAAAEALLGPGAEEALASFLSMRIRELVPQVEDLEPINQLSLYQLDAFLTGWLARSRYESRDDA